jgi:hypothetical protein
LLSVFLVVQFFLSQEVTGKDKALEQLNAKLAQLNDLLSLEKARKLNPRRPARAAARPAWRRRKRARPGQGPLSKALPAPAATPPAAPANSTRR